jgi:hypothetical protein
MQEVYYLLIEKGQYLPHGMFIGLFVRFSLFFHPSPNTPVLWDIWGGTEGRAVFAFSLLLDQAGINRILCLTGRQHDGLHQT